jgi:P27 family predicted phage terminase small subunit
LFRRTPPEAPDFLDGEALDEWNRVVPELQRLELTKPVDRASLTAYCLTWQRLVQAQKEMQADGSVMATNSQGRVRHPAVAVIEAASKELRAWAHEFGLTPSAEQNVRSGGGDGEEEVNPFANL